MAGRMNRRAPIAGLAFAAGAAFAQVPAKWSLTSLVGGDSAMQTIVASGNRVLGASATRLYQTSQTASMSGAIWKRVWPDWETPPGPVRALLASPTAHFIWIGDGFYFCDSALASVPKAFSGVPCCAQAAGEDSVRYYLRYSRDSILAANKADLVWHALHPGAQDTASDDLGRTRAIDRPFLPNAVFRGARVEGRGSLLCWPDPAYQAAPKPWREFPQPIREIWTVRDKLAVRAGSTLYVVDSAGGAWSEKILPADSVTLARLYGFEPLIKPYGSFLAAFTANAIWTPKDFWGSGWQPAPAQIQGQSSPWLGAGPQGTWSATGDGKLMFHLADGRAGAYAWDSLNSASGYRYAEGGSYVAVAAVMGYGKLDTFNIEDLTHGVSRPPQRMRVPAGNEVLGLIADGDFMAMGAGGSLFISENRGRTWGNGLPLPATCGFTGRPDAMFAISSCLSMSTDKGKTWTERYCHSGIQYIAGEGSFLALMEAGSVTWETKVSEDSGLTWTTLPSLGFQPDNFAVQGRRVLAGSTFGVYAWTAPEATALKRGSSRPAATAKRGWIRISGPAVRFGWKAGRPVDARGRGGMPPKASGSE